MTFDWENFLGRLRAYPPNVHRILPPCPEKELDVAKKDLGKMPNVLADMLRHFNGAELFITSGPWLTIFRISADPPLSPLEWAPDWYIDKFTHAWRRSRNRDDEWAIAMTNYGGLILLDHENTTREWDTSQREWIATLPFDQWAESILNEGDVILKECSGGM